MFLCVFFVRCTFAHPVVSACLFSPNECHLFCFQKSSSHFLSSESSVNAVVLIESRLIVFFAPNRGLRLKKIDILNMLNCSNSFCNHILLQRHIAQKKTSQQ